MSSDRPTFIHRLNKYGTFDSICMKCYRTVATQQPEPALAEKEQTHVCGQGDVLAREDPFDVIDEL